MKSMLAPFLTIAASFSLVPSTLAQADKASFQKLTCTDAKGKTMPYRLFSPRDNDPKTKYPLVVFLHGAGSRGSDNEKQLGASPLEFASKANQKKHPCFVAAPQCPAKQYWAPFASRGLVMQMVEDLQKKHNIDAKRLYLTGLSDGGWGTWYLIARYPNQFAAAIPICGKGEPADAPEFAKLPIWVFHGAKDKTEPVKSSRDMVAALKKAGGRPKYTEYPDEGHDAWTRTYRNPKVIEWLFAQKQP